MKLVAGAKMRKAEQAARAAQPYQNTLRSVLRSCDSSRRLYRASSACDPREYTRCSLVVHSSDRGLCGSFNAQVIKFALQKKADYEAEGKTVKFLAFGRKVIAALKSSECEFIHQQMNCKPEDFVDILPIHLAINY